jgi:hypothetical protein
MEKYCKGVKQNRIPSSGFFMISPCPGRGREGNVRGHPSRILAIPERIPLFEFAGGICHAFHPGFDYMFGFSGNLKNVYPSTEGYELFADNPGTQEGKVRPEFKGERPR